MRRYYAITIVFLVILALLPGCGSTGAAASATETVQTIPVVSVPTTSPTPDPISELYQEYTIKQDDSIFSIGTQFSVSWQYIAELNGITGPEYTIAPGNTLNIPPRPKLPGTTGNYLILCETEAQKQYLDEFVAFKTWSGFTVTVKSVELAVKPDASTDDSEVIRQYLKKMDREISLEYVMLIGNPYDTKSACPQHTGGTIPMRYLYFDPLNHNTRDSCDWYNYNDSSKNGFNTPTDIYYAFDFNWDFDSDGYPGEYDEMAESVKQAKPELLFELGRIPFSYEQDIETMLNSTMQYELTRKSHYDALIGSQGVWAYYGVALAENLSNEEIEAVTIFGNDGDEPCQYESTYPLSSDNFNLEANKKYDFIYTMGQIESYNFNPNSKNGVLAGMYFMDSFATMRIEAGGSSSRYKAQNILENGSVSAVIATTRQVSFSPSDPEPRLASLMFSRITPDISGEFYAAIQSLIMENNLLEAYVYCYLGDPSIVMKP